MKRKKQMVYIKKCVPWNEYHVIESWFVINVD